MAYKTQQNMAVTQLSF